MGKKQNSEKEKLFRGKEGFEAYYKNIFGERWTQLKESLFSENVYAQIKGNGNSSYFLDPASVFAAFQLPLENAFQIFDMCAAPGGKSLVLANRKNKDSELFLNERSPARKSRLVQVCSENLSEDVLSTITISCSDAAPWCKTKSECFDSILLDAPCSSERHVLNDEKYLSLWSASRIKSLALEQWSLLSCAYRLLKKGGYILYSTCALCEAENDFIIDRLFKKFPEAIPLFSTTELKYDFLDEKNSFVKMPFVPVPERTKNGYHILPDKNNGAGPIWFSIIQKPCVC